MELKEISRHWEAAGKSLSLNHSVTPTSRDPFLGELERDNILLHLNPEDSVLEVGCGDAAHSVYYANKTNSFTGVDVAESLLQLARTRVQNLGLRNTNFIQASVLDINTMVKGVFFKKIISQRCLINLPNWELQREAILKIHQLLADEGLFILTEGFQENLDHLNDARSKVGLERINVVQYNHNFSQPIFEKLINTLFTVEKTYDYGSYLFYSRLFHPLIVAPERPRHDSPINKVAMTMQRNFPSEEFKKYSYNLAYVLRKK